MEGFEQSVTKVDDYNIDLTSNTKTDSYVKKVRTINDDIQDECFITEKAKGKRKSLQLQLKNEVFDITGEQIYKINQSGFYTSRPMEWLLAYEKYSVNNTNVKSRWM